MNEILIKFFGTANASVIFYSGAFPSLLGAALALRMYRAQSLPLLAGISATLMLAALFFLVHLLSLSALAGVFAPLSRDPLFTMLFLAAFAIFWLTVVLSPSQITATPSRQVVTARKRFRWWLAGLGFTIIMVLIGESFSSVFVLNDVATQIALGTICGIFLMVAVISAFRLWRTRYAIWGWLFFSGLVNTVAALILYQWQILPDGGLMVYACLVAGPLLVIFGLFADQARFVKLESELRRGLLESSFRLEEETRHLKTILASSREMVAHLDRDDRIVHYTPSFVTLLKNPTENCLNKKLTEVLSAEWTADLAPALQDARRGRTYQADKLLRDGEARRLFHIYAMPLRDEKERITGVHLSLFDLAEHGRREVSLETQMQTAATDLQTFRRIVELSTEAIYLTDARHQIIYANEATERLTGLTRAELQGQTPLKFRAPLTAKASHDEISRKLEQGKRYRGDIDSLRKDGTAFLSDVTVVPLAQAAEGGGGEGTPSAGRHIWIERDVTERQRSESALRDSAAQVQAGAAALAESRRYHESLLDAMRELVLVINQQRQCTFMNAAARERLGFLPEKFEVARLPALVLDVLRLDRDYGEAVNYEVRNLEASIRARNGEVVSCSWQARPLFDARGERNGLIAIGRDIADLKEMQSTLADYQQHLEEKVRERTADLQRRVEHLNQLLEIGEGARLHADLDEVMQRMAQSIAALGWQRALVFIREGGDLRLMASSGFARKHRAALNSVQRIDYDKVAIYFDERFRLSRSYFVDSSRIAANAVLPYLPAELSGLIPSSPPAENEWRPRDSMLAPIINKDEIAGLFAVFGPQDGRRPNAQQARDLEIIADDAAIAIANSRLLKSHRRNEHYARILAEVAETFQSTGTLEQIVSGIVDAAARAFDCNVALAFREVEDQWLAVTSGQPNPLRVTDGKLTALLNELTAKKPIVMRKQHADLPTSIFHASDVESKTEKLREEVELLIAPLYGRGQKIGVIAHFDAEGKKSFNDADLGFARDLAERIALTYENAQLFFETEKKARELEQANQMVSDFLASTSHELRTPMQAILSMSDFLLRGLPGKLNDEQQRQIEIIQKSGRSLLALINDILDLSKIEAGKMEATIENFNIQAFLRETAEAIQPLCREKNLRLHVDLAKNLPAQFASDPAALQRVLTNLLGNAVKFTERGEIRLKASMNRSNEVEITVRDTGIGIAPEHQQKVFEPFHQVDRGAARRHGGSGLGLAISKKLVGLLGGTITLESARGKGTIFLLRIPAGREPSARRPVAPTDKSEARKKKKSLLDQTTARLKGKPRILVVEDNENTRYAMQFLLENEGYLVDFADSGEQALLAAQHHKPQLILLDIMMPAMDGYQVSRMLKAQKQLAHIPVVALTARAMKGDRDLALAAGCDDYLTKPFERKDILAVIERWLENGSR